MLLGESSAAPAALREDYRALGLLHLLCVSGMHLWCWAACLRHLLRGRLAVLRLPCLLAVTALAGFAAPVLRALAALAWRAVLTHRGWRVAPLQLWAAALWVEMLLVPARPAGLGFVLSYAATFFLLAATGPVKRNSTRIAVASLAATLGTMPWILRAGGTVQPWAPLLSPLFALLLPVRILCCAAALLPGAEWAAGAVLRITLWPEQALLSLLRGLPGAPWAATTLPFGAALAASLCALWALRAAAGSRLRAALRGSGAAVLLCCLRAPAPAALLALPVGHGLAVVVGSGTQTLLFDLGSADLTPERLVLGRLLPELHRHGWPLPRRVVLSHADDDHGNGVATLAGFGCLALPWIPDGATRVLADCGPWRITLLGLAPELRGAPNAEGQALEVETAGFRAVLLGDAWGHALLDLTRRLRPGPIDLLLLPHHGRTTDGVAELLLHLRPRRAWIACAEDAEPAVLEVMAGLAATGLEVRVERTGPGALELRGRLLLYLLPRGIITAFWGLAPRVLPAWSRKRSARPFTAPPCTPAAAIWCGSRPCSAGACRAPSWSGCPIRWRRKRGSDCPRHSAATASASRTASCCST